MNNRRPVVQFRYQYERVLLMLGRKETRQIKHTLIQSVHELTHHVNHSLFR